MTHLRRIVLLLCLLLTAGAQSVFAYKYVETVTNNDITYYVYSNGTFLGETVYCASLANITGTGDVVVPANFTYYKWIDGKLHNLGNVQVSAVGWWYDQQKAEDITCTANMSSLFFQSFVGIEIHGHFTLQNLYGSLTFKDLSAGLQSTIASDATLDIPHVNALNCNSLKVDGQILAPALPQLTLPSATTVNGTITATNATQATIGSTINTNGIVNTPAAIQVNISQGANIFGTVNAETATKVVIATGAQVTGWLYVPKASQVNFPANSFNGTITSNQLTSITLGQTDFGTSGKLACSGLRDIYIPLKTALPTFYGTYADHFTAPSGTITVHVYDMSANEIAAMTNSAVWNGFKEIVNHKSSVSYSLVNNTSARMSFLGLEGNASYASATGYSNYATIYNGSKTGTVSAEKDYAVEIMGIDFNTKNVTLKRNGHLVSLQTGNDQGQPVRFYEDLNLQQDVSYELSVSDKVCTVSFNQTGYTGRILYQKNYNGTTSTGVVTGLSSTVACAQGSQLKLTIPYDQYTPNKLYLGGTEVTMTKANGEAIATLTLPASATAQVDLTWQAPEQTYETHQPEIMIMRSGEGQVMFKGLCLPEEQAAEAYEQKFGYPAENGVVVSAVSNCTEVVTTVTVPDYDYLGGGEGYQFDATEWGFRAEITPVAGQTLKTLLVGYISEEEGRETIIWEDMLYGENYGMYLHPEYGYLTYNESTNTYTFHWGFDEMNVWIGDYVVNIAMGPAETAVETGATLNFVRQGGRTEVLFEKEDVDGTLTDQVIDEGSKSFNLKYFTEAELEDAGMNYYQLLWFNPVEGETIHVFRDGTDITGQLIYNSETDNARLDLERKNHTYTILIDESPDANPTWTIHNETEGDVVVVQNLKDGTTETATYTGNLNTLVIDDSNVSKVTLRVYAENLNGSKPVRVLKNGQDVSYQFTELVNNGDGFRLCYEVPVSELTNCNWDISYNTDRAQTFVVKGGSSNLLMEYYYENLQGEPTLDISPNGGPETVYLPPFNSEWSTYIDMTVYADAYEGITIKRNGIDVTKYFTETSEGNSGKCLKLSVDDSEFDGYSTISQFGFDIREAAVWEITIDDGSSDDNAVEYMFIGDYDKVYASADYNNDVDYDGFEFMQENVVGYYTEKVVENGTAIGKQGAVELWLPAGATFRAFYDGTDMTNQFTDYGNGDGHWLFVSEDDWMHQPGHHWTIIAETDLMKYDVNRDGNITIADVTKLVNKILGKE